MSAGASTGEEGFITKGYQGFIDFDYDDASLVFIDKPLLLGPSNTSTYASINIGTLNKVMRRCSMAVGKYNISEADFSVALGRRANARHYCSFVWGTSSTTNSVTPYSFNIGIRDYLDVAHSKASTDKSSDIYVVGRDGHEEHIYKYVIECLLASNDTDLKSRFRAWLGV